MKVADIEAAICCRVYLRFRFPQIENRVPLVPRSPQAHAAGMAEQEWIRRFPLVPKCDMAAASRCIAVAAAIRDLDHVENEG